MFFKRKQPWNPDSVNTVLGENAQFNGVLSSQLSLRVDGHLEGEIRSSGDVYIGERSRIRGNVYGKNVIVAGEVVGDVEAEVALEITSTGKIYGSLSGATLKIHEGAVYKGKVNMDMLSSRNPFEGDFNLTKNGSTDAAH